MHRNGCDIQGGPAVRLKSADAALTQNDLGIAPGQNVLRRLQKLRHGGGHAPFQQHRLPHLAQGLEQGKILHIPGAHLQNVHVCQAVQLPGVGDLRHHRQARLLTGVHQHVDAPLTQPLEGVGGCPGLEYASSQQLGPGGLHPPGHAGHLHLGLHSAGPCN